MFYTHAIAGTYRWFSTRLQYLQCVSNGDTAVLHYAIDMQYHNHVACILKMTIRFNDSMKKSA